MDGRAVGVPQRPRRPLGRRLLLVTQAATGLIAAVLAVLTLTDRINVALVMLLSAAGAVAFAFDGPSRLGGAIVALGAAVALARSAPLRGYRASPAGGRAAA